MAITERRIREMMDGYAHAHQPREIAPLERDHVNRILNELTDRIHSKAGFGVTLTEDHNGAWGGQLGQRLLTLRFSDSKKDFITVSMVVKEISSFGTDERNHAMKIADK